MASATSASIAEADAPLSESTQANKPRRLRGDLSSRSSLGRESGQDEAEGSSRLPEGTQKASSSLTPSSDERIRPDHPLLTGALGLDTSSSRVPSFSSPPRSPAATADSDFIQRRASGRRQRSDSLLQQLPGPPPSTELPPLPTLAAPTGQFAGPSTVRQPQPQPQHLGSEPLSPQVGSVITAPRKRQPTKGSLGARSFSQTSPVTPTSPAFSSTRRPSESSVRQTSEGQTTPTLGSAEAIDASDASDLRRPSRLTTIPDKDSPLLGRLAMVSASASDPPTDAATQPSREALDGGGSAVPLPSMIAGPSLIQAAVADSPTVPLATLSLQEAATDGDIDADATPRDPNSKPLPPAPESSSDGTPSSTTDSSRQRYGLEYLGSVISAREPLNDLAGSLRLPSHDSPAAANGRSSAEHLTPGRRSTSSARGSMNSSRSVRSFLSSAGGDRKTSGSSQDAQAGEARKDAVTPRKGPKAAFSRLLSFRNGNTSENSALSSPVGRQVTASPIIREPDSDEPSPSTAPAMRQSRSLTAPSLDRKQSQSSLRLGMFRKASASSSQTGPSSAAGVLSEGEGDGNGKERTLMAGLPNRRPSTSGPSTGDFAGQAMQTSTSNGSFLGSRSNQSTISRSRSNSGALLTPGRRPTTATASASSPSDSSRLEASGGAAALFGGGGSSGRARAPSLKPNLPLFGSRARALSNGAGGALGSSSPSHSPTVERGRFSFGTSGESSGLMVRTPTGDANLTPQGSPLAEVKPIKVPVEAGETAVQYIDRLEKTITRGEVAAVLASSLDEFFVEALRTYMRRFLFVGDPLDIALRKMLMELCLPKETQQIDRVMEAFAKRYNECNEGLFANEDQPYILAFSLMMLHTDAFNKNAKVKMTKADYVKNTASSGVPQDILEYLYDNLTFTEFVYFDDREEGGRAVLPPPPPPPPPPVSGSSGFFASMRDASKDKKEKIDAYLYIKSGRLSHFRPQIEEAIPEDDPYRYTGSQDELNIPALARAYMSSPSIEIITARKPPPPSARMRAEAGEFASAAMGSPDDDDEPTVTLRIFKVGIINRKDDLVEKSKKQSRKWKACGTILSSSQLLFFRDLVWIDALHAQIGEQLAAADPEERKQGLLISPRISNFKPDGVLSLGDAIALKDNTYDKYPNILRLVGSQGTAQQEYLFQARDETDMNEWIAGINFCACFRSAGVRVTNLDAMALNAYKDASLRSPGGDFSDPFSSGVSSPMSPTSSQGTSFSSDQLRTRIGNRRKELLPKLEEIVKLHESKSKELTELLRLARHFAVMTPFQRITRERIAAAASPLAHRIRQLRILVAKYECRRYILASEVRVGDSSTGQAPSIDPRVPASPPDVGGASTPASIQASRKGSYFASESFHSGLHPGAGDASGNQTLGAPSSPLFNRSVSNFSSDAQSFMSDDIHLPSGMIRSFATGAAPAPSVAEDSTALPPARTGFGSLGGHRSRNRQQLQYGGSPAQDGNGEIAESWQSTRAFRDPDRISLAQLPSIDQIEAATREKARRRGIYASTGPGASGPGSLTMGRQNSQGQYSLSGASASNKRAGPMAFTRSSQTTSPTSPTASGRFHFDGPESPTALRGGGAASDIVMARKASQTSSIGTGSTSGSGRTMHKVQDVPVLMPSFGL